MSSEAYREKRKVLRGLSEAARELQESEHSEMTINEILIEYFYTTKEHQIFETLFNWNRKGYKVKKGETAFVIWGSKKQAAKADEKKEDIEENENDFYPLCYLFSNAQVIKKDA
ncbi:hypothetical protein ACI6PS_02550 [Flavobacterium sp. PLA-1-15]|uniref:hypothetical protein n=1 Tax=Flavobacterium sp. PLA-1-15 TaxID=3380533 RepID=UPI003B769371